MFNYVSVSKQLSFCISNLPRFYSQKDKVFGDFPEHVLILEVYRGEFCCETFNLIFIML